MDFEEDVFKVDVLVCGVDFAFFDFLVEDVVLEVELSFEVDILLCFEVVREVELQLRRRFAT